MSITSIQFYIMLAVALILYNIIPLKHRWKVLLVSTIVFIFSVNSFKKAIFTIGIALICYVSAVIIESKRNISKLSKVILILCIVCVISFLFLFKEQIFFVNTANRILSYMSTSKQFDVWGIVAPLGISYFSLTLISYVCEVYWGTISAEKNPFKFITCSLFFPTLTSGPIIKYKDCAKNILCGHTFCYDTFCFGVQRILWGGFKKLVVSERLAVAVNTVYGDSCVYVGVYVPFAAIVFTLQLYTDFSGCIDIIMGVSELFGIKLPESFEKPFDSKSIAEFWRKWNITLGVWLKEYILYPILKSSFFQKIGKTSKKFFGKKYGKKIPTWIALLISWFLIGFWHGGAYKFIFGVGLYMGIIIILSEMLEPVFSVIKKGFKINEDVFSWKLFQTVRTFLLFAFGLSFFRANSLSQGFAMWQTLFTDLNPWVLFDNSLWGLGLEMEDVVILQLSIVIIALTGLVSNQNQLSVREWIANQNIVFRWLVWIILFLVVLLYGKYGPGYSASEFIYKGF